MKQYHYLRPHPMRSFPIGCVPISSNFQAGTFITNGYVHITMPLTMPCTTLTNKHLMHHGIHCQTPLPLTAHAIWNGQAILATDGSVKDRRATYAWILSTTHDNVELDITSGDLIHLSAPYARHTLKRPDAAALYAALTWIMDLLHKYPDDTSQVGETPALPIPVDNKLVINDIQCPINALTPTFQMLTPDYDIIQAIHTTISKLPIKVDIFHVKAHQDRDKPFEGLSPYAQLNILADQHAEQLHQCQPTLIGLFPTWIPGTTAALYHGNTSITANIPEYI